MPPRSPKMNRRILGFQRLVWWPKCTPASSSSRIVTWGTCTPPDRLGQIPAGRSGVPRLPRDTAGAHQIRRVGRYGRKRRGILANRLAAATPRGRRASAAARSAGSSERTSSGSPVSGMREAQLGGVQELALEARAPGRGRRPGRRRRGCRSPPGARGSGGCGRSRSVTRRSERPGRASTSSKSVTASRGRSVSSDIRVGSRRSRPIGGLDPAPARARAAAHEREVGAADPAPAQLRLQAGMGEPVAGDEQQARGVAVEPVDDARTGLVAARGRRRASASTSVGPV